MKKTYLFLPPLLKINDVKIALTGYREKSKIVEQACLLYHILSVDLIKQREKSTLGDYTQVASTKLKQIFDDEYCKPMQLLLDNKLLEVKTVDEETGEFREKGIYSKSDKIARSYRIPKQLLSDDKLFIKSPVDTSNKVLMNKIARMRNLTESSQKLIEANRLRVLNNMDDIILLDNEHSREVLRTYYNKLGKPYTENYITDKIELFNKNPVKRHAICKFGTRLHTEITNNLKEIREDFRFSDYPENKLVEFDLVSSQAWFLSIITPQLIKRFVPECADAIPVYKKYDKHPDLTRFRALCASSDYGIYEAFRDAYNKLYNEGFTRTDAKKIGFRAFFTNYDKHSKLTLAGCQQKVAVATEALADAEAHYEEMLVYGYRYEVKQALVELQQAKKKHKLVTSLLFSHKCIQMFKAEFAGVYDLLSEIKKLKWDFERGSKTTKIKYYANPALLAQRLEANIVYEVIVKALVDAGITKIVTIHDSFAVRDKDAAKAKKIIKQAFASLKLKPSIK